MKSKTNSVGDMTGDQYFCKQTNFDTHISYKTLDAWARFPDFEERYRKAVLHRKSLEKSYSAVKGKQKSVITLASRSVTADHHGSNDPIKRKVNY